MDKKILMEFLIHNIRDVSRGKEEFESMMDFYKGAHHGYLMVLHFLYGYHRKTGDTFDTWLEREKKNLNTD